MGGGRVGGREGGVGRGLDGWEWNCEAVRVDLTRMAMDPAEKWICWDVLIAVDDGRWRRWKMKTRKDATAERRRTAAGDKDANVVFALDLDEMRMRLALTVAHCPVSSAPPPDAVAGRRRR